MAAYQYNLTAEGARFWNECLEKLKHLTSTDRQLYYEAITANADLVKERKVGIIRAREHDADIVRVLGPGGELVEEYQVPDDKNPLMR